VKEETMKKGFRGVLAATSALVLLGVLALAGSPVQASSVDQRIETLEHELARLKQEQSEVKAQAVAAEKKMPLFIYRPGNGLTIAAADASWEVQFGNRLTLYMTFWTKGSDGTSITKRATTNGVLQVRRFRPYMNTRLMDGFYDLRFQMDTANAGSSGGGNLTAFDAEMYIHFENISPWLPYLAFGASPSTITNPQDNNCSSKRCGRAEQSFGSNMAGFGTGSMDRGIGLIWPDLPRFGPARISFLDLYMGQDTLGTSGQFNSLSGSDITADGRTWTAGIGLKPFDKMGGTVGKILKGMEFSFGTRIMEPWQIDTGFNRWRVRTDQTRAQRIDMIRQGSAGNTGLQYYYTPGFGWTWNWVTLRAAGHFMQGTNCVDDGNDRCNDGGMIRGSGYRFMGEFWLWSPKKGLLAGNARDGGFMLSPMINRGDMSSNVQSLSNCGGCKSAHAVDAGIALWYFVPGRFMNLGVIWDHWSCNNCNSDVARVVPGLSGGDDAAWDTITLVSRFQF
jgi:uncharacterized small protein (DUF1192 family)